MTIITTMDGEGRPTGLTASAFTSVSLNPPLILVCVAHDAQSYRALADGTRFAVNILAHDQEAISNRFATDILAAMASQAKGEIELVEDNPAAALGHFRAALTT